MDRSSHEIAIVVGGGPGCSERVPMGRFRDRHRRLRVALRLGVAEYGALPVFKRDEYVTTHEVEIAHPEDRIHVTPGEVLVPFRTRTER